MKLMIWIFGLVLILAQAGIGQKTGEKKTTDFVFDCYTCHTCDKPTKKDPCLKECPRAELITIHHFPGEGPDRIVMDEFTESSDQYEAVVFSHGVHAEMSALSGGCAMCHHNNPPGNILACSACHVINRARDDISKPDLLGSYHRQCMDCHRAWDHNTSCTSCHALKSDISGTAARPEEKAAAERVHPEISELGRLVYQTDYDEGAVVTFYHNEHVRLFGFECADCHKQEGCVSCHAKQKTAETEAGSHDRCSGCHVTDDDCGYCHYGSAQPPFDHFKRTRFAIDGYHQKLSCKSCHGQKLTKLKLSGECNSCHQSWNSATFNHRITGLALDENHAEIECEECHAGRIFGAPPGCDACHDDDIVYPKNKPGKRVR